MRARSLVLVLSAGLLAFAFVPTASAAIGVTCSQTVGLTSDARCTVGTAPVYVGGGCGPMCVEFVLIHCEESTSPRQASCELPYVFCPYGPICPGPAL